MNMVAHDRRYFQIQLTVSAYWFSWRLGASDNKPLAYFMPIVTHINSHLSIGIIGSDRVNYMLQEYLCNKPLIIHDDIIKWKHLPQYIQIVSCTEIRICMTDKTGKTNNITVDNDRSFKSH